MSLELVKDALERGDAARALELVLVVWRATRDPALADLVDRLSSHVARPIDEIFRPSMKSYLHSARWRARIDRRDPLDLPAMLKTASWNGPFDVFAALARWDDDPRLARWTVEQIPTVSKANVDAAYALLTRLRDSRGADALRAAGPPWSEIVLGEHVTADAAEISAIDDVLARRIAAERAYEREKRVRMQRVYAHPDDLAERAVLADWLLEHEDVRGEFIALQLTPTRENLRRAKRHVREHRAAWLGELAPGIGLGDFRFEHGFLASCTIDLRRLDAVVRSREWSTLRHVSLRYDGHRGSTFASVLRKLPLLESIDGMHHETLRALVSGAAPNVRSFGVDLAKFQRSERALVRELAALPRLRRLSLGTAETRSWFIGGGAWRRLDVVSVCAPFDEIGAWLGVLARPESARIRGFWLSEPFAAETLDWTIRFSRPARLRFVRPQYRRFWRMSEADARERLLAALRSIPARSLDDIRLDERSDAIDAELVRIRR